MKHICGIGMALLLTACGGTTATTGDTTSSTTGVRFTAAADFVSSASAALSKALGKTTTAQCADESTASTQDVPTLADNLDCDGDGGIVAHVTPSTYSVAFKRVTLVAVSGGTNVKLIADKGTLAKSQVVDFTSADASETIVTLDPDDLTAGTYSSLGHHQGDITFISNSGVEQGWVDDTWSDSLDATRSSVQDGAGGTDSQTSHRRGYFGDAAFWNATALNQGANQGLYLVALDFTSSFTIPTPSAITNLSTVKVTFSTADTFFYEDFAPQGTGFSPASGGEATSKSTGWAPLAPEATVTVTTGS